jgi:CDP-diacylglycerol pyrophosphatase
MTKTQGGRGLVAAVSLLAMLLGVVGDGRADNPDALWRIVHDRCVPNQQAHADPEPCALVDLRGGGDRGYVILKDLVGLTQYLLIPVARLAGIESAALLIPGAPNYFADAWRERGYTERAAGHPLPRDAISLAINSAFGRTQNELHIHIDCIRADVRAALLRRQATIGDDWAAFVEPLVGHRYRVMRVVADSLDAINPFILLAEGVPGAKNAMGRQTLVVVGADFGAGRRGFVILNDQVDGWGPGDPDAGDRAGGEELQDHACSLARP